MVSAGALPRLLQSSSSSAAGAGGRAAAGEARLALTEAEMASCFGSLSRAGAPAPASNSNGDDDDKEEEYDENSNNSSRSRFFFSDLTAAARDCEAGGDFKRAARAHHLAAVVAAASGDLKKADAAAEGALRCRGRLAEAA